MKLNCFKNILVPKKVIKKLMKKIKLIQFLVLVTKKVKKKAIIKDFNKDKNLKCCQDKKAIILNICSKDSKFNNNNNDYITNNIFSFNNNIF